MGIELKVDKAYSIDELESNDYVMTRFGSGFALFYHPIQDVVEMFKIYQPPIKEPLKRFYYQYQTAYKSNLKKKEK